MNSFEHHRIFISNLIMSNILTKAKKSRLTNVFQAIAKANMFIISVCTSVSGRGKGVIRWWWVLGLVRFLQSRHLCLLSFPPWSEFKKKKKKRLLRWIFMSLFWLVCRNLMGSYEFVLWWCAPEFENCTKYHWSQTCLPCMGHDGGHLFGHVLVSFVIYNNKGSGCKTSVSTVTIKFSQRNLLVMWLNLTANWPMFHHFIRLDKI